jgi:hypothetical protein
VKATVTPPLYDFLHSQYRLTRPRVDSRNHGFTLAARRGLQLDRSISQCRCAGEGSMLALVGDRALARKIGGGYAGCVSTGLSGESR